MRRVIGTVERPPGPRLVASVALVAALAGALAGCSPSVSEAAASSGGASVETGWHAHPHASHGPGLHFYALGDTGYPGRKREDVARLLADEARMERPGFVMLLGDNFYPEGVESATDRRFVTDFEELYRGEELQVPFYAVLGGHDHRGRVEAQLEYAATGGRWRMPARYYEFTHAVSPACLVQFLVLDTEPLHQGGTVEDPQVRWLEQQLATAGAHWKIVAGHHPIASASGHGGSPRVRSLLEPLFDRYGVDLYLAAYEHNLQLLRTPRGLVHGISGAGSSARPVGTPEAAIYAKGEPGFADVFVTEEVIEVEFVTVGSEERLYYQVARSP